MAPLRPGHQQAICSAAARHLCDDARRGQHSIGVLCVPLQVSEAVKHARLAHDLGAARVGEDQAELALLRCWRQASSADGLNCDLRPQGTSAGMGSVGAANASSGAPIASGQAGKRAGRQAASGSLRVWWRQRDTGTALPSACSLTQLQRTVFTRTWLSLTNSAWQGESLNTMRRAASMSSNPGSVLLLRKMGEKLVVCAGMLTATLFKMSPLILVCRDSRLAWSSCVMDRVAGCSDMYLRWGRARGGDTMRCVVSQQWSWRQARAGWIG